MKDPADTHRRVRQALLSIRENALLARAFAEGAGAAALAADRRTAYALARALQLVASAARRLPQDLCDRHPAVAWSAARSAGTIDTGGGDQSDEASRLLDTLSTILPPLIRAVEAELAGIRPVPPKC